MARMIKNLLVLGLVLMFIYIGIRANYEYQVGIAEEGYRRAQKAQKK